MRKYVYLSLFIMFFMTGCGSKSLLDTHPLESESTFVGEQGSRKENTETVSEAFDKISKSEKDSEEEYAPETAYFDDTEVLDEEPEVYASDDVSFLGIPQKEGYPKLEAGEVIYNDDGSYYIYEGTLGATVLITSAQNPTYYDREYHANEIIQFPLCDETAISVYDYSQNAYLTESDVIYLALDPTCYDARTWMNMYCDDASVSMGTMKADNCEWTDSVYDVTFIIDAYSNKVTSLNVRSDTENYLIRLLQ